MAERVRYNEDPSVTDDYNKILTALQRNVTYIFPSTFLWRKNKKLTNLWEQIAFGRKNCERLSGERL